MNKNPFDINPVRPTSATRAVGGSATNRTTQRTPAIENDAGSIGEYDLYEELQKYIQNRKTNQVNEQQAFQKALKFYDDQLANIQKKLDDGIPDDETASEWQNKITELQGQFDAEPGARRQSIRAEQRQWERQLDFYRQNTLQRPIQDEIAKWQRYRDQAYTAYDKLYDEQGVRRKRTIAGGFIKGIKNQRAFWDSFVDGLFDTVIGIPILAVQSPKLITELNTFRKYFFDSEFKKQEEADVAELKRRFEADSLTWEGTPEELAEQQTILMQGLYQKQMDFRLAWMRENAPTLLPIFEYYNESLVSAFHDPETFAKTLEERPFDVYVHILDGFAGLGTVVGTSMRAGRLARVGRQFRDTGTVNRRRLRPGTTERIVNRATQVADIANPENIPLIVGGRAIKSFADWYKEKYPNWQRRSPQEDGSTAGAVGDTPRTTIDDPEYTVDGQPPRREYIGRPTGVDYLDQMPGSTGGPPEGGDVAGAPSPDDVFGEYLDIYRQIGEQLRTPVDPNTGILPDATQAEIRRLETQREDTLLEIYQSGTVPIEDWEYNYRVHLENILRSRGETDEAVRVSSINQPERFRHLENIPIDEVDPFQRRMDEIGQQFRQRFGDEVGDAWQEEQNLYEQYHRTQDESLLPELGRVARNLQQSLAPENQLPTGPAQRELFRIREELNSNEAQIEAVTDQIREYEELGEDEYTDEIQILNEELNDLMDYARMRATVWLSNVEIQIYSEETEFTAYEFEDAYESALSEAYRYNNRISEIGTVFDEMARIDNIEDYIDSGDNEYNMRRDAAEPPRIVEEEQVIDQTPEQRQQLYEDSIQQVLNFQNQRQAGDPVSREELERVYDVAVYDAIRQNSDLVDQLNVNRFLPEIDQLVQETYEETNDISQVTDAIIQYFAEGGEIAAPEPMIETGSSITPDGFQSTGRRVSADDLEDLENIEDTDEFIERLDAFLRGDDDPDIPGSYGGDPSLGDQAGEVTRENAQRVLEEAEQRVLQEYQALLEAIRSGETTNLPNPELLLNYPNPRISEIPYVIQNWYDDAVLSLLPPREGHLGQQHLILRDVAPLISAMNRVITHRGNLARWTQDQEDIEQARLREERGDEDTDFRNAQNRDAVHSTYFSRRSQEAERIINRERRHGIVRVPVQQPSTENPFSTPDERELVIIGAYGVRPETIQNVLEAYDILDSIVFPDREVDLSDPDYIPGEEQRHLLPEDLVRNPTYTAEEFVEHIRRLDSEEEADLNSYLETASHEDRINALDEYDAVAQNRSDAMRAFMDEWSQEPPQEQRTSTPQQRTQDQPVAQTQQFSAELYHESGQIDEVTFNFELPATVEEETLRTALETNGILNNPEVFSEAGIDYSDGMTITFNQLQQLFDAAMVLAEERLSRSSPEAQETQRGFVRELDNTRQLLQAEIDEAPTTQETPPRNQPLDDDTHLNPHFTPAETSAVQEAANALQIIGEPRFTIIFNRGEISLNDMREMEQEMAGFVASDGYAGRIEREIRDFAEEYDIELSDDLDVPSMSDAEMDDLITSMTEQAEMLYYEVAGTLYDMADELGVRFDDIADARDWSRYPHLDGLSDADVTNWTIAIFEAAGLTEDADFDVRDNWNRRIENEMQFETEASELQHRQASTLPENAEADLRRRIESVEGNPFVMDMTGFEYAQSGLIAVIDNFEDRIAQGQQSVHPAGHTQYDLETAQAESSTQVQDFLNSLFDNQYTGEPSRRQAHIEGNRNASLAMDDAIDLAESHTDDVRPVSVASINYFLQDFWASNFDGMGSAFRAAIARLSEVINEGNPQNEDILSQMYAHLTNEYRLHLESQILGENARRIRDERESTPESTESTTESTTTPTGRPSPVEMAIADVIAENESRLFWNRIISGNSEEVRANILESNPEARATMTDLIEGIRLNENERSNAALIRTAMFTSRDYEVAVIMLQTAENSDIFNLEQQTQLRDIRSEFINIMRNSRYLEAIENRRANPPTSERNPDHVEDLITDAEQVLVGRLLRRYDSEMQEGGNWTIEQIRQLHRELEVHLELWQDGMLEGSQPEMQSLADDAGTLQRVIDRINNLHREERRFRGEPEPEPEPEPVDPYDDPHATLTPEGQRYVGYRGGITMSNPESENPMVRNWLYDTPEQYIRHQLPDENPDNFRTWEQVADYYYEQGNIEEADAIMRSIYGDLIYYVGQRDTTDQEILDRMQNEIIFEDIDESVEEPPQAESSESRDIHIQNRINDLIEETWEELDSEFRIEYYRDVPANIGGYPMSIADLPELNTLQGLGETLRATLVSINSSYENAVEYGLFWSPSQELLEIITISEEIRLLLESQGVDVENYNNWRTEEMARQTLHEGEGLVDAMNRMTIRTGRINPIGAYINDVAFHLRMEHDIDIDLQGTTPSERIKEIMDAISDHEELDFFDYDDGPAINEALADLDNIREALESGRRIHSHNMQEINRVVEEPDIPGSYGGDPSEGDQLGEPDPFQRYRELGAERAELNIDPINGSGADWDRWQELQNEIAEEIVGMYDRNEPPFETWRPVYVAELEQYLRHLNRQAEADDIREVAMEQNHFQNMRGYDIPVSEFWSAEEYELKDSYQERRQLVDSLNNALETNNGQGIMTYASRYFQNYVSRYANRNLEDMPNAVRQDMMDAFMRDLENRRINDQYRANLQHHLNNIAGDTLRAFEIQPDSDPENVARHIENRTFDQIFDGVGDRRIDQERIYRERIYSLEDDIRRAADEINAFDSDQIWAEEAEYYYNEIYRLESDIDELTEEYNNDDISEEEYESELAELEDELHSNQAVLENDDIDIDWAYDEQNERIEAMNDLVSEAAGAAQDWLEYIADETEVPFDHSNLYSEMFNLLDETYPDNISINQGYMIDYLIDDRLDEFLEQERLEYRTYPVERDRVDMSTNVHQERQIFPLIDHPEFTQRYNDLQEIYQVYGERLRNISDDEELAEVAGGHAEYMIRSAHSGLQNRLTQYEHIQQYLDQGVSYAGAVERAFRDWDIESNLGSSATMGMADQQIESAPHRFADAQSDLQRIQEERGDGEITQSERQLVYDIAIHLAVQQNRELSETINVATQFDELDDIAHRVYDETNDVTAVADAIVEYFEEGGTVNTPIQTQSNVSSANEADMTGYELTGETVSADDLDALFADIEDAISSDDDDDPDIPGSYGGDPAQGDQAGERERFSPDVESYEYTPELAVRGREEFPQYNRPTVQILRVLGYTHDQADFLHRYLGTMIDDPNDEMDGERREYYYRETNNIARFLNRVRIAGEAALQHQERMRIRNNTPIGDIPGYMDEYRQVQELFSSIDRDWTRVFVAQDHRRNRNLGRSADGEPNSIGHVVNEITDRLREDSEYSSFLYDLGIFTDYGSYLDEDYELAPPQEVVSRGSNYQEIYHHIVSHLYQQHDGDLDAVKNEIAEMTQDSRRVHELEEEVASEVENDNGEPGYYDYESAEAPHQLQFRNDLLGMFYESSGMHLNWWGISDPIDVYNEYGYDGFIEEYYTFYPEDDYDDEGYYDEAEVGLADQELDTAPERHRETQDEFDEMREERQASEGAITQTEVYLAYDLATHMAILQNRDLAETLNVRHRIPEIVDIVNRTYRETEELTPVADAIVEYFEQGGTADSEELTAGATIVQDREIDTRSVELTGNRLSADDLDDLFDDDNPFDIDDDDPDIPGSYGGDPRRGDQAGEGDTDELETENAEGSTERVQDSDSGVDTEEGEGGISWQTNLIQQNLSETEFEKEAVKGITADILDEYNAGELPSDTYRLRDLHKFLDALPEDQRLSGLRKIWSGSPPQYFQNFEDVSAYEILRDRYNDIYRDRLHHISEPTYTENISRSQIRQWDNDPGVYFRIDTRGRREETGWMGEPGYLDQVAQEIVDDEVMRLVSRDNLDQYDEAFLEDFIEDKFGGYEDVETGEELPPEYDEGMLEDELHDHFADDSWWVENRVADILEERGISWSDELDSYRSDGIYVVRTIDELAQYVLPAFHGEEAQNIVDASQNFDQVVQVIRGYDERRPAQFEDIDDDEYWDEFLVSDPEILSEFPAEMLLDVTNEDGERYIDTDRYRDLADSVIHRFTDDPDIPGSYGGDPALGDQLGEGTGELRIGSETYATPLEYIRSLVKTIDDKLELEDEVFDPNEIVLLQTWREALNLIDKTLGLVRADRRENPDDENLEMLDFYLRDWWYSLNSAIKPPDPNVTIIESNPMDINGTNYDSPIEYLEDQDSFIWNEDDLLEVKTWEQAVEFLEGRLEGIDDSDFLEKTEIKMQLKRLKEALEDEEPPDEASLRSNNPFEQRQSRNPFV